MMPNQETYIPQSQQNLKGGLTRVLAQMEEYLRATASQTGEKLGVMRESLQEGINKLKNRVADTTEIVVDKTKVAARATDDYVNDNPWRAMGIAAAVGMIVGILISRRGD